MQGAEGRGRADGGEELAPLLLGGTEEEQRGEELACAGEGSRTGEQTDLGEEKGGVPHRSTMGRYAIGTCKGRTSVCG